MSALTLIALLLGILAVVAAFLIIRRRRDRGRDEPQRTVTQLPPEKQAAPVRPELEPRHLSRPVRGTLYRYQDKSRIHRGADFYKMFIDGSWKWKGQQRYAGVHVTPQVAGDDGKPMETKINTGHYFALHPSGAKAEVLHYKTEEALKDFSLLEVEADFDNVLDLTDLRVIRAVADAMSVTGNIWAILAELIAVDTGGGEIPTVFGYYGWRHAHMGILSFSARAIQPHHAERLRKSTYWDDLAEDFEKMPVIEGMQRLKRCQCVVVFSGAVVTRFIKRYRFDEGVWEDNPYFGCSAEEIDALWGDFGPGFQASQGRVTFFPKR
jgi:hypothetical protein